LNARALLDSNVLIAMVVEAHEHHLASLALLTDRNPDDFAISAHSYAETYSTLTRGGAQGPFGFAPAEAWAAIESLRAVTTLVGLTAARTFDAVRAYAATGGVGTRLYDKLIGEAAVANRIPAIVSWNIGHMRGLFPDLIVVTPQGFSGVLT
jgi:predicted nucleic acid-binding protein